MSITNQVNAVVATNIAANIRNSGTRMDNLLTKYEKTFTEDLTKLNQMNAELRKIDIVNDHMSKVGRYGINRKIDEVHGAESYRLDDDVYQALYTKKNKIRKNIANKQNNVELIQQCYKHIIEFRQEVTGEIMYVAVLYKDNIGGNSQAKLAYVKYADLLDMSSITSIASDGGLRISVAQFKDAINKQASLKSVQLAVDIATIQKQKRNNSGYYNYSYLSGNQSSADVINSNNNVLGHSLFGDFLMGKIYNYGFGLGSSGPGYAPQRNESFVNDWNEHRTSRILEIYASLLLHVTPQDTNSWHEIFMRTCAYSSGENTPGWQGGDSNSNVQVKNMLQSNSLQLINVKNIIGLLQRCKNLCNDYAQKLKGDAFSSWTTSTRNAGGPFKDVFYDYRMEANLRTSVIESISKELSIL